MVVKISIVLFLLLLTTKVYPLKGEEEDDDSGDSRIISKEEAKISYQVALFELRSAVLELICGGTILDHRHILTAAQCLEPFSNNFTTLRVMVGDRDLRGDDKNRQIFKIKQIYIHEEFDCSTFENDIALIRTMLTIVSNENVMPLDLTKEPMTSDLCTVSGWGFKKLEQYGFDITLPMFPSLLREMNIGVFHNGYCGKGDDESTRYLYLGMRCGSKGGFICDEDVGGPVECENYLRGIISWGYKCDKSYSAFVFTEIGHFYEWINETIELSFMEESAMKRGII